MARPLALSPTALLLLLALFASPLVAADETPCAAATPEETWSNASAAFAAEELGRLTGCLDRTAVGQRIGTLLNMSGQLVQMVGLTQAEEGTPEHDAVVEQVRAAEQRLLGILRAQNLPTTAEEANALDAEERAALTAAIDATVMYPDLILFIESLDEDGTAGEAREGYFTAGSFDRELTDVTVDGDTARGYALGAVDLVRVDGLWYLIPPG